MRLCTISRTGNLWLTTLLHWPRTTVNKLIALYLYLLFQTLILVHRKSGESRTLITHACRLQLTMNIITCVSGDRYSGIARNSRNGGVLNIPWRPTRTSLPDPSSKAEREMEKSQERRSEIWLRGGRGWWSKHDESKVVYPDARKKDRDRRWPNS